jgi:hypothetical protein
MSTAPPTHAVNQYIIIFLFFNHHDSCEFLHIQSTTTTQWLPTSRP